MSSVMSCIAPVMSSTYCLVTASVLSTGSSKLIILLEFMSMLASTSLGPSPSLDKVLSNAVANASKLSFSASIDPYLLAMLVRTTFAIISFLNMLFMTGLENMLTKTSQTNYSPLGRFFTIGYICLSTYLIKLLLAPLKRF